MISLKILVFVLPGLANVPDAASIVVKAAGCRFWGSEFDDSPLRQLFVLPDYVHIHMNLYIWRMYLGYTLHEQVLTKYVQDNIWKHNMYVHVHGIYNELWLLFCIYLFVHKAKVNASWSQGYGKGPAGPKSIPVGVTESEWSLKRFIFTKKF